jgi:sulfoxide reductase catalytic subunit YedY
MLIRQRRPWDIPERELTPESACWNRREILAAAGFFGAAGLLAAAAPRNPKYTLDRPITDEAAATGFNNYYEFDAESKERVRLLTDKFVTTPWKIEVKGLVNKPQTFDLDDLLKKMKIEERTYRFRCVEAWSMAVPWMGFPLADLIKLVDPKPEAKFVRFQTTYRPDQMPGIKKYNWYPWPYFEGVRIDEALNELAFVATGLYGKPLPKQNGAPFRMVFPWKYGYKGAKSVEKIEFVAKQPETFWNRLQPQEYGFYSNVNPKKPHPRWSQATEKVIPNMERRPTLLYNGYEQFVSALYNGDEF